MHPITGPKLQNSHRVVDTARQLDVLGTTYRLSSKVFGSRLHRLRHAAAGKRGSN